MASKQARIKQIEKQKPKPTVINPYAAMSDAELVDAVKAILESGEYIPEDMRRKAERILRLDGDK